jgi:hypothetical protein
MRPHPILRRQLQVHQLGDPSSDPNPSNSLIGAASIPKRPKHSLTYLLQRHPRQNGHLNNLTNSDGSPTKLLQFPRDMLSMLLPIRIRESTFRGAFLACAASVMGLGYVFDIPDMHQEGPSGSLWHWQLPFTGDCPFEPIRKELELERRAVYAGF